MRVHSPLLVGLGLFLLSACHARPGLAEPTGDPAACPTVKKVSIVSAVGDQRPDAKRKLVRSDQPVTLFAVVEATLDGKPVTFSKAGLGKARNLTDPTQWPAGCPATVQWYKVEAEEESYNNARSRPPATIEYTQTKWLAGWSVTADVHPTRMHDEYPDSPRGLGTMRYKVTLSTVAGTSASPGIECRESGAACRDIHAVAYRPDDTYLGYLHELLNVPYIYGSKRIKGGHQSDLLVGSDCADFAVYGKRRQRGPRKFGYTYTGGLYKLASKRTRVSLDSDGFYVDRKGRRLSFGPGQAVRPGDLLNFPGGHVGVLVRDDGDGQLDLGDFLMHTLFHAPEIVSIRDCRWGQLDGKEILRLKD